MVCLLGFQVVLAGVGLWWMFAKRLHYAGYEIRTPSNFYMGVMLFFQLPMCFFVGTSAGAAEAINALVSKQPQVDTKKIQKKWWWIDPALSGTAVVLAAGIAAVSVRREQVEVKPHEAPIGVRDYVFDQKQKDLSASRRRKRTYENEDDEVPA
ncbi:hypothetical protein [Limnoglobus roseus]|uniref:Uncharacterized protein n=1 Tax=Limnoglobus roseus TaxID=2598579 RepID=A0A5C1A9Y6_9BACT|nr:hypothetical protein [Limnoglobus roseus]QEL14622.1 hypothetical protein PX52LOC_01513 [Limnoglobus roseus]